MVKKNVFRNFSRETVIDCMQKTGISRLFNYISGEGRMLHKTKMVDFDTFETLKYPEWYFAEAMNTELEHGMAGADDNTNVTGDDALKTAQIAAAHIKGVEYGKQKPFKPFYDYYDWLWFVENLHERALELNHL